MIRIANCSGFYGDRLSAAKEQVEGGPIDVLTGDWLAELTMLILLQDRMKDPKGGFAKTFLLQMREVLGACLGRGIRVVSNAGGLNPHGLVEALREAAAKAGLNPRIAVVDGDDVLPRLAGWQAAGDPLAHLDGGRPLAEAQGTPMAANAYLGCWGVAEALAAGADVVITGRGTDAAPVMGAAAWKHGWKRDDWDALAGALVAGHVIECGAQATGGNYAFYDEIDDARAPGFPIAEIDVTGASVITKHRGTPGAVTVGTVTAQLMYEVQSALYHSPDVIARLDTVHLSRVGLDQVAIAGVRGLPPSGRVKVGINLVSGWRNRVRFQLMGVDAARRGAEVAESFWALVGGREAFSETRTDVIDASRPDPQHPLQSLAFVECAARSFDMAKLDRGFTSKAVELPLASVPGLTLAELPGKPSVCGVFWPTLVPAAEVAQRVHFEGRSWEVRCTEGAPVAFEAAAAPPASPARAGGSRGPLGAWAGARSGDKAGNANVGFWVREPAHLPWLEATITEDWLRRGLPGFEGPIRLHRLPNLLGINAELVGYLGEGVGASLAVDPQAKGLAEYLRARVVSGPG